MIDKSAPNVSSSDSLAKRSCVKKPWGYEFEYFENTDVSIWVLCMGYMHKSGYLMDDSKTSFHMHEHKSSTVLCIDGAIMVETFSGANILRPFESTKVSSKEFHRVSSYLNYGIALEIESPNDRNDIARLFDSHGRVNKGYDWNHSDLSDLSILKSEVDFSNNFPNLTLIDAETGVSSLQIYNKNNTTYITGVSVDQLVQTYDSGSVFICTEGKLIDKNNKTILLPSSVYVVENLAMLSERFFAHNHGLANLSGFIVTSYAA
ncbi:hypothetical protein [Synechococcus sp. A15-28]|uniref:hypothetical protein n=1 Tax=Synechococcus sp. A15-28 TaxID=1050638 RepID=UPI00164464C9|nr:hypothetical protein [Synechococcus sp. A15-28]